MTSRLLPTPNTMDHLPPMEKEQRLNHKSRMGRTVSGNLREEVLYRMADTSFSQEVSPVSLSHAPGSAEARKMTAISGKKCCELLKSSSPLGSSVRTLMESDQWSSKTVYLNWKEIPLFKRTETAITQTSWTESATVLKQSAMKFSRLLFQLAPSTPRTEGTGCGLLGTPRVVQSERSEAFAKGRVPTPQEALNQIAMLPTPATRDYKGARKPETLALTGMNPETNSLEDALVGKNRGLKLHSDFVSWMQGYPLDWLDI